MLSGSTLLRHLAQFYCAIYNTKIDLLLAEVRTQKHTMEHYLSHKQDHEKENGIVKAINESHVEIAN